MNVLIVEDESHTANLLKEIIEQDSDFIVTEQLESVVETIQYLSKYQKNLDLLFFDIQLADGQSFEIFKHIDITVPIVFCTAYDEYTLQAIKNNGIDYVLKPFKEEELKARVANLIRNSQNRIVQDNVLIKKDITTPSAPDLTWLKELEEILKDNISNSNFKISDVAHEMALSPRRLQQKIKEITGLTPKQYQRSIRLHKARTLLKSGDVQTVSEVMYQIGFDNPSYFSKMYLKEFGVTPSQELK